MNESQEDERDLIRALDKIATRLDKIVWLLAIIVVLIIVHLVR